MAKEDELFQTPATIVKLETMSDGGVRIVVDTQELTDPMELTKLFELRKGQLGYFLFKGAAITEEDIPEEELRETDTKSHSQRLRAVMFVYWKEVLASKGGDFDSWYRQTMEEMISRYKEKLPPKGEE